MKASNRVVLPEPFLPNTLVIVSLNSASKSRIPLKFVSVSDLMMICFSIFALNY